MRDLPSRDAPDREFDPEDGIMEVVHPSCAGMDVHKDDVKVCLVWRDAQGVRQQEIRTYATTTGALLTLSDWLTQARCPIVAMESTGVYWKPIYNLLEDAFTVWLVNPAHLKHVEGRKTDPRDAAWLAKLLEHGLLQPSYIPPRAIRDLREVTRYRRKLVQERDSQVNRVQKLLEDANTDPPEVCVCGLRNVDRSGMVAPHRVPGPPPAGEGPAPAGLMIARNEPLSPYLNGNRGVLKTALLDKQNKRVLYLRLCKKAPARNAGAKKASSGNTSTMRTVLPPGLRKIQGQSSAMLPAVQAAAADRGVG